MYDPTIGRWISEDPIGFAGGDPNLYRYVGNSPTNATDPTGLVIEPTVPPFLQLEPGTSPFQIRWWFERYWLGHDGQNDVNVNDYPDFLNAVKNNGLLQRNTKDFKDYLLARVKVVGSGLDCNGFGDGPGGEGGFALIRSNRQLAYSFRNPVSGTIVLGNGAVTARATSVVHLESCGCGPDRFRYHIQIDYSLNDAFTDPYDLFDTDTFLGIPLPEQDWNPNGNPYNITGSWSEELTGTFELPCNRRKPNIEQWGDVTVNPSLDEILQAIR